MNAYTLLYAMSGIREEYVLEGRNFLASRGGRRKRGAGKRKLWTTLLVAAVIVSLFTVTAYAMGWLGLRDRMIESVPASTPAAAESAQSETSPAPVAEPKRWVSLNGYRESPEYLANAQWLQFREDYLSTHVVTNDNSWMNGLDQDTINTCHYYGVYDQNMLDELNALAEQYGLRLHTRQVTPIGLEDFYRTAGTGAFLTEGKGTGYIYEDGSFSLECDLDDRTMLLILKSRAGTILPYAHGIADPESYQEWEYTNVHGDTVWMAYNEKLPDVDHGDLRIYFDLEGVFIEVTVFDWDNAALIGKEACEGIADKILFHELLKTEPDFSVVYEDPTVCADPGDAATLADFLASPEGMAALEYSRAAVTRRDSAQGEQELEALRREIPERYGLQEEGQLWQVAAQEEIDAGVFRDSPFALLSFDDFAAKGYDRRITDSFYTLYLWENGVLFANNSLQWFYIPDGSFCDYPYDLMAETYPDEWYYRTECGAVVLLCAELGNDSSTAPRILYRTAHGWLIGRGNYCHNAYEIESWANEIDYTLFP